MGHSKTKENFIFKSCLMVNEQKNIREPMIYINFFIIAITFIVYLFNERHLWQCTI